MKRILLVIAILTCTGCATGDGGAFGWFARRGERDVKKAEEKVKETEGTITAQAHEWTASAAESLKAVPPSRATDVTTAALTQSLRLLDSVLGPISLERQTAIKKNVDDLLSENEALRAAGEAVRAAALARDVEVDAQLGELKSKLQDSEDRNKRIAGDNARMAGLYMKALWASVAGAVCTAVLTAAVFMLKRNMFGMASAAGDILGNMRAKYGVKDEDVLAIEAAIDAPTSRGMQSKIASLATEAMKTALAQSAAREKGLAL